MEPLQPINVRLSRDQLAWLDAQRQGPIVTRSEVLRHIVADAMAAQRDKAATCAMAR